MGKIGYEEVLKLGKKLLHEYSPEKVTGLLKAKHGSQGILETVANDFARNVRRIEALVHMPAQLMAYTGFQQAVNDKALFNLTKDLAPPPERQPARHVLDAERRRLWEETVTSGVLVSGPEGLSGDYLVGMARNLEYILETRPTPDLRIAMEVFLSDVIASVHTAFETLAGDLWVKAVNLRPDSLGKNIFGQDASLSFSILREFQYSVKDRLGDIAHQRKNVGTFLSLDGIKVAYQLAFKTPPGAKNASTSPRLIKLFDNHFKDIRVLELIRNLLVHQGGRVDKKFKNLIKSFDQGLSALPEGDSLPVDGQLTVRCVEPALLFSLKLLEFVDDWLTRFET